MVVEFEPWRSDFERSDFRSASVVVMQAYPGAVAVQGHAGFLCVKGSVNQRALAGTHLGKWTAVVKIA